MQESPIDVVRLPIAMAKEKPFNNPFSALKAKQPEKQPAPAARAAPSPAKKKESPVSSDDESALFFSAMGAFDEVKPVREPPAPKVVAAQRAVAAADDVQALLELAEMVIESSALQVKQTAESVLACPRGFDAELLGKLPPTSQLDMQALAPASARGALERFIVDAHVHHLRSVRVIAGAEHLQLAIDVLAHKRLARQVLAFSGNADTLDVVLRR